MVELRAYCVEALVQCPCFGKVGFSAAQLVDLFWVCNDQDVLTNQTPFEHRSILIGPLCQHLRRVFELVPSLAQQAPQMALPMGHPAQTNHKTGRCCAMIFPSWLRKLGDQLDIVAHLRNASGRSCLAVVSVEF